MILANAPISEYMSKVKWTVTPDETVAAAGERMKEGGVHHLPVLDANGDLCGIVSALDLLRVAPEQRATAPVSDVMSADVESVPSSTTVRELLDRMGAVHFNAFPVVDDGKLVGIVTSADLEQLLYSDF